MDLDNVQVADVVQLDEIRVSKGRASNTKNTQKGIWLAAIVFLVIVVVVLVVVGFSVLASPPPLSDKNGNQVGSFVTNNGPPNPDRSIDRGTGVAYLNPAAGIGLTSGYAMNPADDAAFIAWKTKYNKSYSSKNEELSRYAQWRLTQEKLVSLQQQNPGATFEAKQWADVSDVEFQATHLGPTVSTKTYNAVNSVAVQENFGDELNAAPAASLVRQVPASFDWRTKNAVTPVHDQQQCGACWAFTSSDVVATQNFLRTGNLQSLSPQQMIDCESNNLGCRGGVLSNAFSYIRANGLEPLPTYPYVETSHIFRSTCKYNPSAVLPFTKHITFGQVSENVASIQKHLVSIGTLAAVMDASSLQHYSSGVLSSPNGCSSTDVNHAVEIVGYGTDPNAGDYWLVKNSWGTDWGENGYFRIRRGTNLCAIESGVMYAKRPA